MYNKNNIAVAKVASKSSVRPELACVAFYGDRTVATDSYRLIEMSASGKKRETPTLFYAKDLMTSMKVKKNEGYSVDEESIPLKPLTENDHEYPSIDMLFDRVKGKEYVEVEVNAGYLAEICTILKELDTFGKVTLKLPVGSTYEPVILEAVNKDPKNVQTARALLMPMSS